MRDTLANCGRRTRHQTAEGAERAAKTVSAHLLLKVGHQRCAACGGWHLAVEPDNGDNSAVIHRFYGSAGSCNTPPGKTT